MKRLISVLLVAATLISTFCILAYADTSAKTELSVNWNMGYVGSATNSTAKNSIGGPTNTNWSYTDIITIPKAGTKISFSVNNSGYATNSVWLFSEWVQSGDTWKFNLAGANVVGTANMNFIGQTLSGSTMNYEFISDHDNQSIRICLNLSSTATHPTIYMEENVSDKSTLQQLNDLEFTGSLADTGKVTGLKWFCGYTSSAINDNGSKKEYKYGSSEYAFSNMFVVPKKGTKLTYTLYTKPNNAFNVFTRYKLENGVYVYDIGFDASSTLVSPGVVAGNIATFTYTYVTEYDNEILRVGVRPYPDKYTQIYVDQPVEISWELTNEEGTASKVVKTSWPDAELISIETGAPLIADAEVVDLKWVNGYIGSQYHSTSPYAYTSPSNQNYYTSDVFNVPKKGTTVYFFDQTFVDADGSNYASTSVMTVSHWKKMGNTWVFDKKMPYFNGCDVYNVLLTKDYRVYAYTTTEDDVNLRLCMRYMAPLSGEEAIIPPVYLVEPTDFDAEQPDSSVAAGTVANCKLFTGSYTDMSGETVEYKYYLPYGGGKAEGQYSLVFDNSADGAIATYLAENAVKNSIVIAYNGNLDKSLRLLDAVVKGYPVKVSDILLVGDDELGAHAAEFDNIRLANAFLYTGTGTAPTIKHSTVAKLSDFGSTEEAALWLLGKYDNYYDVLEGLKLYAIGDSYFGGSGLGNHQTWVNTLGYKYDMTFHNFGIGGNTIATDVSGQIGSNQPAMHTRYQMMPDGGDIYFIEGGRNDRRYCVPFGNNTDTTGTTFKGAINIIIDGIKKDNPDALIVLVTAWSYANEVASDRLGTNNDYADAMKELAEYRNDKHVICLYAADKNFTGVDMGNYAFRSKYCLTPSDVSHLNADGMYMVREVFDKWLAEQYAAFKGLTLTNDKTDDLFYEVKRGEQPVETTAPDVTTAPTTQTPPEPEKKGCGGFSASIGIIAVALCAVFGHAVIIKKK